MEDNNNQYTFADFVTSAVANNFLRRGDILVVDNAALHSGQDTYLYVRTMLQLNGITLIFLPTYSPELNPCELCFSIIKNFIKEARIEGGDLYFKMLLGINKVERDILINFYRHCIHPKVLLPDLP